MILHIVAFGLLLNLVNCCVPEQEDAYGSFPYIEIDEADFVKSLGKEEQSLVIPVSTNRELTIENEYGTEGRTWFSAVFSDNALNISVMANDLEVGRTGTITVSSTNNLVQRTIQINQSPSGELTVDGDLILRSKEEIAASAVTKLTGNLYIGDIARVKSPGTKSGSVTVDFDGMSFTAAHSTIADEDIAVVSSRIHQISGGMIVIANTETVSFPLELVKVNEVKVLLLDYSKIASLPEPEVLEKLGLTHMSLKSNNISDISSLSGNTTIEYLDLSSNPVQDISPLLLMPALKKLDISGLPISQEAVDVLVERLPNADISAMQLNSASTELPLISKPEVVELDDKHVRITASITSASNSVDHAGFYIGSDSNISKMDPVAGTIGQDGTISVEYEVDKLHESIFYVRSYAVGKAGTGYSPLGRFGSLTFEGDYRITSQADLEAFMASDYTHINGSFIIQSDTETLSVEGKPYLDALAYVRDAVVITNTDLAELKVISSVKGFTGLTLSDNRIKEIPQMSCSGTLQTLDVSRNCISNIDFLKDMPSLTSLRLGDADKYKSESNDIGVVDLIAQCSALQFVDLSGLPLHDWQVEELRTKLPSADIRFVSAGRIPHIPTMKHSLPGLGTNQATLRGYVVSAGKSDVTEYGFYFGTDPDNMSKIRVGESIASNTLFTYDVSASSGTTYYFYPYAVNAQGESRNKHVDFQIDFEILSDIGQANSYIVKDAKRYRISPLYKGNTTVAIDSPVSAEVLWEVNGCYGEFTSGSLIRMIELTEDGLEFVTTGNLGNALIAVKDGAGKILWSWHIWATDMPGVHTYTSDMSEYEVMDRNLGAISAVPGEGDACLREASGTLYQWGRKDPFIADSGYQMSSSSMSFESSADYPTMFNSHGWTDTSVKSWMTEEKSEYDPCPVGYMVAGPDVFSGLDADTADKTNPLGTYYLFSAKDQAFYPYPGLISAAGVSSASGKAMWTSSGNLATASALSLPGLAVESKEAREAMPVRCRYVDESYRIYTYGCSVSHDKIIANGEVVKKVQDAALTEKGFVLSASNTFPTLASCDKSIAAPDAEFGEYSCEMTDISYGSKYYLRSYAISGGRIKYGEVIELEVRVAGIDNGFTEDDYEW